jgi:DIS3-like exonuclease 2
LIEYLCSGNDAISKENYFHYGLAVPLYTHFTSPISRYSDILVHRLSAASLGYCDLKQRYVHYLKHLSETSNDKKTTARACSEKSSELYFSLFVNECGPLEEHVFVVMIKDHSFDVLINNLGVVKRIYCDVSINDLFKLLLYSSKWLFS